MHIAYIYIIRSAWAFRKERWNGTEKDRERGRESGKDSDFKLESVIALY